MNNEPRDFDNEPVNWVNFVVSALTTISMLHDLTTTSGCDSAYEAGRDALQLILIRPHYKIISHAVGSTRG
jgi:hypothetical protein